MARSSSKMASPEVSPSGSYVSPIDRPNGPWDDYDVKGFLRTLMEAEKIRKNKGLMRRLRVEASKQLDALKDVAAKPLK